MREHLVHEKETSLDTAIISAECSISYMHIYIDRNGYEISSTPCTYNMVVSVTLASRAAARARFASTPISLYVRLL